LFIWEVGRLDCGGFLVDLKVYMQSCHCHSMEIFNCRILFFNNPSFFDTTTNHETHSVRSRLSNNFQRTQRTPSMTDNQRYLALNPSSNLSQISGNPPIYLIDNFLSKEECEDLIGNAEDAFRRSDVVGEGEVCFS